MVEIPAILYYWLILALRLRALVCCISHFDNKKKLVISEQDEEKAKALRLNKPWRDFERQIADCFSQRWREMILGPWEADDWIDVRIRKNWKVYVIQCKHWYKDWVVRPKDIREFAWAINLYKQKYKNDAKWIFITTWFSTSQARQDAYKLWIQLWDTYKWERKINTFEG